MNFKSQEKLFDIEWYEGPMMSLFINKKGEMFIYKWVDINPESHTWLVFRTTRELVGDYVQSEISERTLILRAPDKKWCLVDITPKLEFLNKRIIAFPQLLQNILPVSDTYFIIGDCIEPEKLQLFISEEIVAA